MVTEQEMLEFFRQKLPELRTLSGKPVLLQMDDVLQEYAEVEDIALVIDAFSDCYGIEIAALNIENYFPWRIPFFFRKWFTDTPVKQTRQPLTVRMFLTSAQAGLWLYH